MSAPRPITSEQLSGELQNVLFAQQLILFAPMAVQATKHVPMLQVREQLVIPAVFDNDDTWFCTYVVVQLCTILVVVEMHLTVQTK